MNIGTIKQPMIRQMILCLLAQNGGRFKGTERICLSIPAARQCVQRNLSQARRLGLVRCRHHKGACGRGNQTFWYLTQDGWHYV
jgi:hypothetical protein